MALRSDSKDRERLHPLDPDLRLLAWLRASGGIEDLLQHRCPNGDEQLSGYALSMGTIKVGWSPRKALLISRQRWQISFRDR